MSHTCHVHSCKVAVLPRMLMCKPHWAMVPRVIQSGVKRHYREGQCDGRPSEDWLAVAKGAVLSVSMRVERDAHRTTIRLLIATGMYDADRMTNVIRERESELVNAYMQWCETDDADAKDGAVAS